MTYWLDVLLAMVRLWWPAWVAGFTLVILPLILAALTGDRTSQPARTRDNGHGYDESAAYLAAMARDVPIFTFPL